MGGGGDWLRPKIQKPSHWGSGLANEMWVGWFLGIGDPIGVGYIGFEKGGLRFGEALGAGSFVRAHPHSFACPRLSRSFVCLSFVCAHPHSFPLVFAGPQSSQPLICVCIKYIVSKYIIAKKLTFMPWIINLDKNY